MEQSKSLRSDSTQLNQYVNNHQTPFIFVDAGVIPAKAIFISASSEAFGRISYTYSITEAFKPHYSLIRGLLEFCRSREFSFTFNSSDKEIRVNIAAHQVTALSQLLDHVGARLSEELRFKKALKYILNVEEKYKRETQGLYAYLLANA